MTIFGIIKRLPLYGSRTVYIGNTRVEHTHISATHVHIYTRAEYTRTHLHMYRINTCGKSGVTGGVLDCVFTEHI